MTKKPKPLPPIMSAYLNIKTARNDALDALDDYQKDRMDDCKMWVDNAISQLQSASAKIGAHILKMENRKKAKNRKKP